MDMNNCECPHARVLVDHGIPIIEEPACGKADCISEGCQKEAAKITPLSAIQIMELVNYINRALLFADFLKGDNYCKGCRMPLIPVTFDTANDLPSGSLYRPCACKG